MTHWKNAIFNFVSGPCSSEDTIRLVEIKSAMHTAYHVYTGNKAGAVEAASYFALTRRDLLVYLASNAFDSLSGLFSNPKAIIKIAGVETEVDSLTWDEINAKFKENPDNPDYGSIHAPVDLHAGNPLVTLWNYAFPPDLDIMSQERLRELNNQFTFLRHKQARFDSAYDAGCLLLSVIGRSFFGIDPFDPEYVDYISELVELIEYTRHAKLQANHLVTNRLFMMQVREKFDDAARIMLNPRLNTAPRFIQTSFRKAYEDLEVLSREATAHIHGSGDRNEPLSILLTGKPSGGKSTFTKNFMKAINRKEKTTYDPTQMYTPADGSEYWDGYNKQRFVVIDDLWKTDDKQDRARQTKLIVDLVNTSSLSLNIAKCEGKGVSYFDSEFIIWSTNIANDGLANTTLQIGATDNNAILRRFHVVIHQDHDLKQDLWLAKWRVDVCPLSEYVWTEENDRYLSTAEMYHMLIRVRELQVENARRWDYTDEEIDRQMGFETHNSHLRSIPGLFGKIAHLGLYDWDYSAYRTHLIVLFCIIGLAAIASPLYKTFFPVSTNSITSEPDWFNAPTMVQENGKWVKWNKTEAAVADEHDKRYEDSQVTGNFSVKKKNRVNVHSADLNCAASMLNTISRAMVYISAKAIDPRLPKDKQDLYHACVATHIKDGYLLTCAHWFNVFEELHNMGQNVMVFVRTKTGEYAIPFPPKDQYHKCGRTDAVCIKIPASIPPIKDISDYLNMAEHANSLREGTKLQMLRVDHLMHPIYRSVTVAPHSERMKYDTPTAQFFVERPINYFDSTQAGESGSLLIAEGPQGRPVIVGMHAGNKREFMRRQVSFAIPLLKEQLLNFIGLGPDPESDQDSDLELHMAAAKEHTEPFFPVEIPGFPIKIIRKLPKELASYSPNDSAIKKSQMHGWNGQPKQEPARLKTFKNKAGDIINPLHVALSKVRQEPFEGFEIPSQVYSYLQSVYPQPYKTAKVLTFDEALNGIPERGIPAVRMDTSPGYPYTLRRLKPGKHSFITRDKANRLHFTPETMEIMEKTLSELKLGKQMEVLWADNLKDETRPVEKNELGKTRLISSCPLHMLIMTRMYFADFVSYVQRTPTSRPVAVGINVHSGDWRMLHARLSHTKDSIISGDFSNFDGSIPSFLNVAFVNFVNWWYNDGEENAAIRHLIMANTTNAFHIIANMVYQAAGGEPSGEPITSIKNSFINMIATFYILNVVLGIPENKINLAIYGDDIIIALGVSGVTWEDLAPHYLKYFGMVFTHCSKKEHSAADTLETITFLGRKFVAQKFAPLDINVVVESTYWYRGNQHKDEILLSTVECFFLELSHHTERDFNYYGNKLLKSFSKYAPHLLTNAEAKRRSYHYYQKRKYDPSPNETPFEVYYDSGRWLYRQFDDVEVHSGKGVPYIHETEPSHRSDRVEYTPIETQSTEIGEFRDVGPVSTSSVDTSGTQSVHEKINMEHFTLDDVITRTYQLDTITWNTSQATETILETYLFPDELFTIPFLANKILDFNYFTADVLMSFRVISNKFLYGCIMADYCPRPNVTNYQPNTVQKCSGSHHVRISASAADAVSFSFPFVDFARYLDLNSYAVGEMGRVRVRVADPLTDVNGTVNTISVIVTAQFVNARLYYPTNLNSVTLTKMLSYKKNRKSIQQKCRGDDEFDYVEVETHSGRGEALAKSRGTISNSLISKSVTSAVVSLVGDPSRYKDYYEGVSTITRSLGMLGLSKPTTLATSTVVKLNPSSDMVYGKGIDTSLKLTMDPENKITTLPNVGGISHDEMDLKYILMTPSIYSRYTLLQDTQATIICPNGPSTSNTAFGYMDYLARMFSHWSGSIKVKIYIIASMMHKVTLVFYLSNSITNDANWESCYNVIVDVSGDTEVSMTLPYLGRHLAIPYGTVVSNLFVKVLAWNVPEPTNPAPVYLTVYRAAASDFELYGYKDVNVQLNCNPRADFAQDFPFIHASMSHYSTDGYIFGEKYTTVREIIHRYHNRGVTPQTFPTYRGFTATNALVTGIEMFGLMYFFERGSMRFKHVQNDARYIISAYMQDTSLLTPIFGAYLSSPSNPILEYEVPYYDRNLFRTTGTNSNITIVAGGRPSWLLAAAGDDFSFIFLRLPPNSSVINSPVNSTNAMLLWLNSYDPRVAYPPPP